jgi:hypothetical protein
MPYSIYGWTLTLEQILEIANNLQYYTPELERLPQLTESEGFTGGVMELLKKQERFFKEQHVVQRLLWVEWVLQGGEETPKRYREMVANPTFESIFEPMMEYNDAVKTKRPLNKAIYCKYQYFAQMTPEEYKLYHVAYHNLFD